MEHVVFKFSDASSSDLAKSAKLAECMTIPDMPENLLETEELEVKEPTISNVLSCFYCNVKFEDLQEQRQHFKLDWHRYNIKHAIEGKQSVSQDDFQNLADDVSSISGSESEDEDFEPDKQRTSEFHSIKHAKVFFESGNDQIWSVYKCLIQGKKENLTGVELVTAAQGLLQRDSHWLVIMLGGGHFAAAIFEKDTPVVHKTFHCYTVRAKQGGAQHSSDKKGGPAKSAGASLRRYNEQALVQHVQTLLLSWKEQIAKCDLVLFRAAGPYNRAVLFGGKNAPLKSNDTRLRAIPFPTRRATMSEVKRVYQMLSTVKSYGSASDYKTKFPKSPDRRQPQKPKKMITESTEIPIKTKVKEDCDERLDISSNLEEKGNKKTKNRCVQADFVDVHPGEGSSESEKDLELGLDDCTIEFADLKEYEDTGRRSKKKKTSKQKAKLKKEKVAAGMELVRLKLLNSIRHGNESGLNQILARLSEDTEQGDEGAGGLSREELLECIKSPVNEESKDTVLHLASSLGRVSMVTTLLKAGADLAARNKHNLPPYSVAADKQTKEAFKAFAALNPAGLNFKDAHIPEPLTEEQLHELEEKRKERKREKRQKEKVKKKENYEKREEEKEKNRFLELSDREKCALAAERRLLTTATKNIGKAKQPILHRCFQCGLDITGKVPFIYGNNKFCTVTCLKEHRAKTNSYGVEI